jgi:hypothetical protein
VLVNCVADALGGARCPLRSESHRPTEPLRRGDHVDQARTVGRLDDQLVEVVPKGLTLVARSGPDLGRNLLVD